jgi:hypothetical protein
LKCQLETTETKRDLRCYQRLYLAIPERLKSSLSLSLSFVGM